MYIHVSVVEQKWGFKFPLVHHNIMILSAFLWSHTYSHYIINASLYIILCTHTPHAQMLSLPTSPILDIVSHPLWWVVVLKEGDTFTFLCIHFHYIITNVHNIMNNASWYHGALPPAYPVRIGWSVSPHIHIYTALAILRFEGQNWYAFTLCICLYTYICRLPCH